MSISINKITKTITNFLIFIALLKIASLVGLFFLPKSGVDKASSSNSYNAKYYNYRVATILEDKKEPITTTQQVVTKSLTGVILKAIFAKKDGTGFIIIEESNIKKTYVLSIGEKYKEFVLSKIFPNQAIFTLNGQEYTLMIDKKMTNFTPPKDSKSAISPQDTTISSTAVNRNDIDYYVNNFDKIWENVAIKEKREGGKIVGFLITHINTNSIFNKLGLRLGDLIVAVNNKELKSYQDAFAVYKQVEHLRELKITVKRDNQLKDIEYEIY